MPKHQTEPVEIELIEPRTLIFRNQRVMLDRDLAALYGVTTSSLKQAVRRNRNRFPNDFMFEIGLVEARTLISQIVISNEKRGGSRHVSYAFTEQGVAMLSTVLRSERAIMVNIQIMRTFTRLRQMIATHEELRSKLELLELRYDEQFKMVFDAMRQLLTADDEPKESIGFV